MNQDERLLLLEIKEVTEILQQEPELQEAIERASGLKVANLLGLSFVEDQFTEELVGHLYDKRSGRVYEYIFQPNDGTISLREQPVNDKFRAEYPTVTAAGRYLQLSQAEIAALD